MPTTNINRMKPITEDPWPSLERFTQLDQAEPSEKDWFFEELVRGSARSLWTNAVMSTNQPVPQRMPATQDLANIQEAASSRGYPIPEAQTIEEVRRIVTAMRNYLPLSYEAFPMPDGGVGIGVDSVFGRSMILICEPPGSAFCVVTVDRVSRQAKYDKSDFLIDDFVKEGLRDMSVSNVVRIAY